MEGRFYIHPLVLHYLKCTDNIESCKLEGESIKTVNLVQEQIGPTRVLIYPETGTRFATLNFENNGGKTCILGKELTVNTLNQKEKEGPICNAPEAGKTKREHTIECLGGEGETNLKMGEWEMTYRGNITGEVFEGATALESAVIEGK